MTMEKNLISVVIPTFKRAETLEKVMARYLLPCVGEVVVVDDCSPDKTEEVVRGWSARDQRVRYMRTPVNRGQCFAKNMGVDATSGAWVFFGEDDAYPLADALPRMLEAAERTGVDVVGLRTIHLMGQTTEAEALTRPVGMHNPVDLERLRFWFNSGWEGEVPAVHAWMLVRRGVFEKAQFDTGYIGSAYREETDFCFNAGQAGFRLYHCGGAVMIHLARRGSGGSWSRSRWKYEMTAIRNNRYMLKKHYRFLKGRWGLRTPAFWLQWRFAGERMMKLAGFVFSRFRYRMQWYGYRLKQVVVGK